MDRWTMPAPELTPEDRRLLELVIEGRSTEEIAERLRLSRACVRKRLEAILTNLLTTQRTPH